MIGLLHVLDEEPAVAAREAGRRGLPALPSLGKLCVREAHVQPSPIDIDLDHVTVAQQPEGASDGNIVFDSNKDPIGVNTGLLAVCDPSVQNPGSAKQFECNEGIDLLAGTGFGKGEATCSPDGSSVETGGASTGWLHTTAPVQGTKIITLRFAVWDTQDEILDSTALIDKFEWSVEEPQVETTPIVL